MMEAADLSQFLSLRRRRYGDRAAVSSDDSNLSFAGLDAEASRWAGALTAQGIARGKRIGLLAANSPRWLALAFATWRAGATLVPLSTFTTPRELAELIEHAELDLLFVSPQLGSHDLLQTLADSGAPIAATQVLVIGTSPLAPHYSDAEEWLAGAGFADPVEPRPEDIACLLYTSGTTGRSKGVLLSHRAILATVGATAERSGLGDNDSMLSTLPLFWVAGLVIRALPTLASGCTLILMESFSAAAALAALGRHRPTALHLRPPQIGQLLDAAGFEPGLLAQVHRGNGRSAWFAGALPQTARLITGYGMTEMSGYVTALDWRDSEAQRRDGIGHPLPGVELRIVDAAGNGCEAGVAGRVQVRGPGMYSGYFKEPPHLGLTADGWFDTGDVGTLGDDGQFRFVGRDKDLLRVKGINVAPVEVEAVLMAHAGVEAAYVVGLPPDGVEQELVAVIIARLTAQPPPESELRQIAVHELSVYKRPSRYVFAERSEIPLGGTSKPKRDAVAHLAASRLGTS